MAITCRLALLSKKSPSDASETFVRHYRTKTFPNHQKAHREAQRLNAVVCAWTPARRASA